MHVTISQYYHASNNRRTRPAPALSGESAHNRATAILLLVHYLYLSEIQTTAWQVDQCIIPPQMHSSRQKSSTYSPRLAMLPAAFLFGAKAFVCLARLWLWMLKSLGWKKTTHTSRRPIGRFTMLCVKQDRRFKHGWPGWGWILDMNENYN